MLSNLILTTLFTSFVSALTANTNVALYWGQNSEGSQTTLGSYCKNEEADIFIMAFIDVFGSNEDTQINFADACSDEFSDGLLKCDQIAEDIKTCQSLGKTVLLSMGGASGSYGFTDDADAEAFATTLWEMFGNGANSAVNRPFGDSVVDGFDFDIENNSPTGYPALANKLRTYFDADDSKTYYLSAAPQCPYPDASVGELLEQSKIDFAFIQFYNNYCSTIGDYFNWDTWAKYATDTSPNKDIKLFLGLPADASAAGSGYATPAEIQDTLVDYIVGKEDSNFGGIVLWDASWSGVNTIDDLTFGNKMKQILDSEYPAESDASTSATIEDVTTSTSSSTSTSTSSTSSSTSTSTSSTSTSTSNSTSSSTSTSSTLEVATTSTTTPTTTTTSATTTSEPATTTSKSATTTSEPATTTQELSPNPPHVPTSSVDVTSVSSTTSTSSVEQPTTTPTFSSMTTITTSETSADEDTSSTVNNSATADSTSGTASPSTATATATDCSSLSGLAKAQCMNKNFENGLFLGSASSCTEGEFACSSNGAFAMCNFGSWVEMECAAGTTCYAYNFGDDVDVGCDYTSSKSKYEKRDGGVFSSIFKRHAHYFH